MHLLAVRPARYAGVVHGDLKAANVLLTRGGEDVGGLWAQSLGYRVTAKVADFGLALSLDPKDTHATMAARVSVFHVPFLICRSAMSSQQLPSRSRLKQPPG
jgi:serine/threonine protein kinase